ncbi:MAG: elongation factor G [Deltaproteobacteria bacterium]
MKVFESKDIRNVGLIGHKACGKTSVAESALWAAKVTNRLGQTAGGTSALDFEPEEEKRVMSVSVSVGQLPWKKTKINLLDTPGDGNFLKDTRVAMQAMDGVVLVVSAKDGVEPMTDRVFNWASDMGLMRAILISKMDAEHSSFEKTLADLKENLTSDCTAVQIPIGKEAGFSGVVDLLSQKAYMFGDGDQGAVKETDIPADMVDAAEEARNALIEDIATNDEALMEKFFEGTLTTEEIVGGLKNAMSEGLIVPVFCASGLLNRGVTTLLDFLVDAFPNPLEAKPYEAREGDAREAKTDGPVTCLCFKTVVDQHAGKISVMRVLSGTASSDPTLENNTRSNGTKERLGSMNTIVGKKLDGVDKAPVGDIIAVTKLKDTHTGDTLSEDGWVAKTIELAAPLISRAVSAAEKGAEDKISAALNRIVEEDPGLTLTRDERTGQILLNGTGQQHVEVAIEKMERKFGVKAELSLPQVPYLETFTVPVKNVEGKHKKQTGGAGQFGVCYLDFEPTERGSGFVFEDAIVGGSIPRQFIPSVEKGCVSAMKRGVIAGFPLVDVKVRLFDGKYHPVDSKDMAFQLAASKAFKAAAPKARAVLLEPIMNMEVMVPEDNMGDVMGDVNTRRGRVLGSERVGKYMCIKAQIPYAEIQQYEATLRSMTQGRGSFTMEKSHMDVVPPNIQDKIIKESGFTDQDDED